MLILDDWDLARDATIVHACELLPDGDIVYRVSPAEGEKNVLSMDSTLLCCEACQGPTGPDRLHYHPTALTCPMPVLGNVSNYATAAKSVAGTRASHLCKCPIMTVEGSSLRTGQLPKCDRSGTSMVRALLRFEKGHALCAHHASCHMARSGLSLTGNHRGELTT